jgi:hypothetical protein
MPDLTPYEGLAIRDGAVLTMVPSHRMNHSSFPFAANFASLYSGGESPTVDAACVTIEAEWAGIFTMWATIEETLREQKRTICEGYLVAWWLADMFPISVTGVIASGGIPVTSKSIGGVSISFRDLESQPALRQLESNAFGVKALMMIMSAPERMGLMGARTSYGPAMRGIGVSSW